MRFGQRIILGSLFLLSLVGVGVSLFVSEVLKIPPCSLCWWQRVFLFPQVLLYGVSYFKNKDWYIGGLPLSAIGGAVAFYQSFFVVNTRADRCVLSVASDCSNPVFKIGFVTFPLLSFILFCALILLGFVALWQQNKE